MTTNRNLSRVLVAGAALSLVFAALTGCKNQAVEAAAHPTFTTPARLMPGQMSAQVASGVDMSRSGGLHGNTNFGAGPPKYAGIGGASSYGSSAPVSNMSTGAGGLRGNTNFGTAH